MATKPSDAEIKAYVQQNINNPEAIRDAAAAYGVSIADLARATNFSADQVSGFFNNAKLDTSALVTKITPNEAAELMRRSQVTGVPTSTLDAAGGYAAVKALAAQNTTGYQAGVRTVADMAKYAPTDPIVRFDPAGQGGLGETFYASGNSATGGKALTVADTGTATTNTGTATTNTGTATTNTGTAATNTGPAATITGAATTAATVTPGSVSTPAATSTAQTAPVQLNTPVASGGAGLITGANTLASGATPNSGLTYTPGTFNIGNMATGNVNTGGLITGAQQQLFTQNAQVGLPTGVTPTIGAMGNNTGGASIQPYNPFGFKFNANTAKTGGVQNYYNPKTGQRYTAPPGYTPPSSDWQTYTPGAAAGSGVNLNARAGTGQTILG